MIPRVRKREIIVKYKENMQLQGCAMPYRIAPCLLGWMCRFCSVRGRSRHDLAMIWEQHACVCMCFIRFVDTLGQS
jgi:hypothetical protein